MAKAKIKVTQTKSTYGRLKNHKACVAGLGLRRIGHTVEVEDTPVRGMINAGKLPRKGRGLNHVRSYATEHPEPGAGCSPECQARRPRYRQWPG